MKGSGCAARNEALQFFGLEGEFAGGGFEAEWVEESLDGQARVHVDSYSPMEYKVAVTWGALQGGTTSLMKGPEAA